MPDHALHTMTTAVVPHAVAQAAPATSVTDPRR